MELVLFLPDLITLSVVLFFTAKIILSIRKHRREMLAWRVKMRIIYGNKDYYDDLYDRYLDYRKSINSVRTGAISGNQTKSD